MSYIDGLVFAVPTANMQKFIAHATDLDSVFLQHGATRVNLFPRSEVLLGNALLGGHDGRGVRAAGLYGPPGRTGADATCHMDDATFADFQRWRW